MRMVEQERATFHSKDGLANIPDVKINFDHIYKPLFQQNHFDYHHLLVKRKILKKAVRLIERFMCLDSSLRISNTLTK